MLDKINQMIEEGKYAEKGVKSKKSVLRTILCKKVRERDNDTCCFCKRNIYDVAKTNGRQETVHHKLPVRYGGEETMENNITICLKCHRTFEKLVKFIEEYHTTKNQELKLKITELKNMLIYEENNLKESRRIHDKEVTELKKKHNQEIQDLLKEIEKIIHKHATYSMEKGIETIPYYELEEDLKKIKESKNE